MGSGRSAGAEAVDEIGEADLARAFEALGGDDRLVSRASRPVSAPECRTRASRAQLTRRSRFGTMPRMKKQIITIAGSLGSGKSSTARAVATALGYRHFSSGDPFRQPAVERGESIEAMNISAEVQRDIDLKVDNLLQEMYRADEQLVIDSRMAWHWMPGSFKVFLVLDPDTAAARILNDLQGKGRHSEDATSIQEVRDSIDRRFASEQKRYAALYGVNATDLQNFDLAINTKHNDLKTVTAIVCAAYRAWHADEKGR